MLPTLNPTVGRIHVGHWTNGLLTYACEGYLCWTGQTDLALGLPLKASLLELPIPNCRPEKVAFELVGSNHGAATSLLVPLLLSVEAMVVNSSSEDYSGPVH